MNHSVTEGEYSKVSTWGDLLHKLQWLTPEQLAQPIQVRAEDYKVDGPRKLLPGYCFGPWGEMTDGEPCICNRDGGNNQDSLVLFVDVCRYSADGDFYYTLDPETGLGVGNKSGKVVDILKLGDD